MGSSNSENMKLMAWVVGVAFQALVLLVLASLEGSTLSGMVLR